MICSAMVRAYCHKVIKLSDTLQTFCPGKEVTCNVHGVREEFWKQGLALAERLRQHQPSQGMSSVKGAEMDTSSGEDDLLLEPRVYFLGKLLWAKGLDIMLDLQEYYKKCTGSYFAIDVYGSGPDAQDIQKVYSKKRASSSEVTSSILTTTTTGPNANLFSFFGTGPQSNVAMTFVESSTLRLNSLGNSLHVLAKQHLSNLNNFKASLLTKVEMMPKTLALPQMLKWLRQEPIPASFLGRADHAHLPHDYIVFVNPSVSEVLCTATAEALAMGKFAIIPYHPSNFWFMQFPNCLQYRNKLEFAASLRWAMSHNPQPLTEEQAKEFSWQAATERLFQSAAMTNREAAVTMHSSSKQEAERIAWFHNEVLGKGPRGDLIRKVLGAGPVSEQVRYQQEIAQQSKTSSTVDDNSSDGIDEEEEISSSPPEGVGGGDDENEGLGQGFAQSWFATAFRRAWNDAAKMGRMPEPRGSLQPQIP